MVRDVGVTGTNVRHGECGGVVLVQSTSMPGVEGRCATAGADGVPQSVDVCAIAGGAASSQRAFFLASRASSAFLLDPVGGGGVVAAGIAGLGTDTDMDIGAGVRRVPILLVGMRLAGGGLLRLARTADWVLVGGTELDMELDALSVDTRRAMDRVRAARGTGRTGMARC